MGHFASICTLFAVCDYSCVAQICKCVITFIGQGAPCGSNVALWPTHYVLTCAYLARPIETGLVLAALTSCACSGVPPLTAYFSLCLLGLGLGLGSWCWVLVLGLRGLGLGPSACDLCVCAYWAAPVAGLRSVSWRHQPPLGVCGMPRQFPVRMWGAPAMARAPWTSPSNAGLAAGLC